jgi:signal transduction histidine kinase
LESGRTTLRAERVDVKRMVAETVAAFASEAESKGIKIEGHVAEGADVLHADADMLMQVLTNLTGNAMRYAKSSVAITVAKKSSPGPNRGGGDEALIFSVEDDGPGIPDDARAGLFSKFHQINRPVGGEGYKGTGLGLAICKEIVALHRGHIEARGTPGLSAEFVFEIPLSN